MIKFNMPDFLKMRRANKMSRCSGKAEGATGVSGRKNSKPLHILHIRRKKELTLTGVSTDCSGTVNLAT